jgi:hypothetical protein
MGEVNCITDDFVLSVKRYGLTAFIAKQNETYHTRVDITGFPSIDIRYIKVIDNALVEMTTEEKTIVDLARIAADKAISIDALQLKLNYADENDLPQTPREDGLLVTLTTTAGGRPGMAISQEGAWRVYMSV